MINVEQFHGSEADVNSFILYKPENAIVIDVLRSSEEAEKLADRIEALDKKLAGICYFSWASRSLYGLRSYEKRFPLRQCT